MILVSSRAKSTLRYLLLYSLCLRCTGSTEALKIYQSVQGSTTIDLLPERVA
jgi:hypothetical protein